MAKKKTPKRSTTHHASTATKKPRKKRAKRRGPVPAGMVLVRASDLGHASNPAKKKKRPRHHRRGHHHPQKRNPPESGEHKAMDLHRGVKAIAFGTVAAVAGLAGGAAIAHLGPDSKGANIAANLAGTVIGGLVGMFDQPAGTLIAHNYAVAAGQWALAPTAASRGTAANALQRSTAMAARMGSGIATPNRMLPMRAVNGMDDVEGLYADNMGDVDVEGVVVADNMGDAEVEGFEPMSGFEAINGLSADTLGDADEMGEELDGFDDPFGDMDD